MIVIISLWPERFEPGPSRQRANGSAQEALVGPFPETHQVFLHHPIYTKST